MGSCDVLLALIGGRWLTITSQDGRRRLDNPDNFVRLEIEAALARNVRVIPILVDAAQMPHADELPPSLAKLARRQALELSPNRFDTDTRRLLRVLDQTVAEAQEQARQDAEEAAARQRRQVDRLQGELRERAAEEDWLAVVAASEELAALDPAAADPDGLASAAREQIIRRLEAESAPGGAQQPADVQLGELGEPPQKTAGTHGLTLTDQVGGEPALGYPVHPPSKDPVRRALSKDPVTDSAPNGGGHEDTKDYHAWTVRRGRLAAGAVALVVVVYFGIAAITHAFPFAKSPSAASLTPQDRAIPRPSPTLLGSEQDIVTKVKPGVVVINTTLQYDSEKVAGTGMVINPDGLVLTNNSLIEDSTKIAATVVATGKTYTATVVGYGKTWDVALIQLQNASGLATVPVGNSSSVKTGEAVVALGNAEGQNTIAATSGQVTVLNKTITASDHVGSTASETLHGMIQTNADTVPGDEGGPLASSTGVIGMDTASNDASSQRAATTFAIPINTVLSVARQIAAGQAGSTIAIGYPAFLGVFIGSGSSSSPHAQAQQWKQQNGGSGSTSACYASNSNLTVPSAIAPVSSGTLVIGTICGSSAASEGITSGAVITAVNGQAVGLPDDFTTILSRFHPGDTISVTWVSSSGKRTTSSLHLTAGPPQ